MWSLLKCFVDKTNFRRRIIYVFKIWKVIFIVEIFRQLNFTTNLYYFFNFNVLVIVYNGLIYYFE